MAGPTAPRPSIKSPEQAAIEAILGLVFWGLGLTFLVLSLGWQFGLGIVLCQLGGHLLRLSRSGH